MIEGESLVYVKEHLGHSSIKIRVDICGQRIKTKKKRESIGLMPVHPLGPYLHLDTKNPA